MASYITHEFKYKQQEDGPKEVNDILITYTAAVQIVGVDGVSPDDPKAEYTLEGDGSASIKISKISKSNEEALKIRVKGQGRLAPSPKRPSYWTLNGKRVGKSMEFASAALDEEMDTTIATIAVVEPLLEEMKSMSACMELLASSIKKG